MTQTEQMKQKMAQKVAATGATPKAQQAAAPQQNKGGGKTIEDYLKQMAPAMAEALPKQLSVERLTRLTMTVIRTTPKLKEASPASLLGAVMQAAQLGLEPGPLGHCYFLPFENKKKGIVEVQFIIGYKGMIDLARRSGHIESIYAHAVHEKDVFEFELGLDPKLRHVPCMTEDRGEFLGTYAVAKFMGGGYQMDFMPRFEIEKRRLSSPGGRSKYSPWVNWYDEMAKKTVLRNMWKYLPISIEIQQMAAYDGGVGRDIKDITPEEEEFFLEAPEFDYHTAE